MWDTKFPKVSVHLEILCGDTKFPYRGNFVWGHKISSNCTVRVLCGDTKFSLSNIGEILCGDIKFPL